MKKQNTKEMIQKVAADLFQKFGFEKTSMDDIAQKAHKAKRSIYNHFNSKEDLFTTAVQLELDNVRAQLQTIVDDDSQLVLPRLRQYLLRRVQLLSEAGTLQVTIKNNMLQSDDYRFEEVRHLYGDFSNWEHDIFKKIWYAKPTTDALEIVEQQAMAFADMLQVTLNGLTHTFFAEEKYEKYKSSYEMLVNLIVKSIFQNFQNNQNILLNL